MISFFKEQNGSALIWSLFIILILFTLSFIVYSAVTVYTNYQTCENELQRAAIISTDINMENPNVRDLMLDIPTVSAEPSLKDNLIQSGWVLEDKSWRKSDGDKTLYSLEDIQIETKDRTMQIDVTFAMPLPWAMGDMFIVRIPM